jgi:hypothetical protein
MIALREKNRDTTISSQSRPHYYFSKGDDRIVGGNGPFPHINFSCFGYTY